MSKIHPAAPLAALRPQARRALPADPDSPLDARIEQSLVPLRIGNRWYTLVVCVDCVSRVLLSYRLSPAPLVH